MKSIARLVRRLSKKKDNDGMIMAVAFKDSEKYLKPGYVYEIREILGELVVVEIGKSWIGKTNKESIPCWGHTIQQIRDHGPGVYLSEKEYKEIKT